MRRALSYSALACALLVAAAPAFAQDRAGTWEISPFAGAFLGGRLYGNDVPRAAGAPGPGLGVSARDTFLDEDDDLAYGARLGYNVTRHFGLEVDWTSSRTDLRLPYSVAVVGGGFVSNPKVGRLRQNIYEVNALFNFGRRRAIGYVGIGGGAAVERMESAASISRFTANLSIGGKFFFVPRVGLRIDARYRAINLTDDRDGSSSCDHNGFRDCDERRNWSYNGEVTGGLVFAF
ncbi:MAG: outer membrane beta-barrel protein [Thermoanaerobaculia bacterium]|nr:outer membrane beta-barrel protein [Thermoanaerobaculia bacterium]